MTLPTIRKLYFSPVKSLSFSNKENLIVKKNIGIKNDRTFAFTRLIDKKESYSYEKNPEKRNLNFFLTLRNSPFLNKYNFEYRDNVLSLLINNKLINKISLDNRDNFETLSKELMYREKLITKTPHLVYNKHSPFFDTTPNISISLINLGSVEDFEDKIKRKIEHERFRGNIYINNIDPWKEFNWIGRKILINGCLFKVVQKISRCSATNLVPKSETVDLNLPLKLKEIYGHSNMGVYLMPLTDGDINENNIIKL